MIHPRNPCQAGTPRLTVQEVTNIITPRKPCSHTRAGIRLPADSPRDIYLRSQQPDSLEPPLILWLVLALLGYDSL